MLKRGLFLLILAIPNMASANEWTCVTVADLSGDPSYYWSHGRDAWQGSGLIECTSGKRTLRLGTMVRYEGKDSGIGASQNSRIAFESMPIVTRSPSSLAQKMTVTQDLDGMTDSWISMGSKVNLSFLVYGNQLDRFADSIRNGKLNILVNKTAQ